MVGSSPALGTPVGATVRVGPLELASDRLDWSVTDAHPPLGAWSSATFSVLVGEGVVPDLLLQATLTSVSLVPEPCGLPWLAGLSAFVLRSRRARRPQSHRARPARGA